MRRSIDLLIGTENQKIWGCIIWCSLDTTAVLTDRCGKDPINTHEYWQCSHDLLIDLFQLVSSQSSLIIDASTLRKWTTWQCTTTSRSVCVVIVKSFILSFQERAMGGANKVRGCGLAYWTQFKKEIAKRDRPPSNVVSMYIAFGVSVTRCCVHHHITERSADKTEATSVSRYDSLHRWNRSIGLSSNAFVFSFFLLLCPILLWQINVSISDCTRHSSLIGPLFISVVTSTVRFSDERYKYTF